MVIDDEQMRWSAPSPIARAGRGLWCCRDTAWTRASGRSASPPALVDRRRLTSRAAASFGDQALARGRPPVFSGRSAAAQVGDIAHEQLLPGVVDQDVDAAELGLPWSGPGGGSGPPVGRRRVQRPPPTPVFSTTAVTSPASDGPRGRPPRHSGHWVSRRLGRRSDDIR